VSDFFDKRPRLGDDGAGERGRRRAEARQRARRQRRAALGFVMAAALVAAAAFAAVPMVRGDEPEARPDHVGKRSAQTDDVAASLTSDSPTSSPSPSSSASSTPTKSPKPPSASPAEPSLPPSPTPKPSATVAKPPIVADPVPYGTARKQQMAAYSKRHYGAAQATWVLKPKAVVLHYTAGGSYSSAHNYFSGNTANLGELPGVCAHFIIDKDGKIYQQLALGIRCRHTIGLNYAAVGIEFVQEAGSGPTWATNQIFNRSKQINAGLRLVRWLKWKYKMPTRNILGHGTANASPLFKDLQGWRNDHVDWNAASIARFKTKLAAMD